MERAYQQGALDVVSLADRHLLPVNKGASALVGSVEACVPVALAAGKLTYTGCHWHALLQTADGNGKGWVAVCEVGGTIDGIADPEIVRLDVAWQTKEIQLQSKQVLSL